MLILQVVRLIGIFGDDISLNLTTKIKVTIHKDPGQASEFDSPPYDWSSLYSNDFHGEYLLYILCTTILQHTLNRRSAECS
jgi:hypothetical protein